MADTDGDCFETQRLRMQRWQRGQEQAWFAIFGDAEVTQLAFGAPDQDLERSRIGFENTILRSERDAPLGWWAVIEKASGAIVGTIGLNTLPDGKSAELGGYLRRDAWGKGYATEAALTVIRRGFAHDSCKRITAVIHPQNKASRRVLEKLGFSWVRKVTQKEKPAEEFEKMG